MATPVNNVTLAAVVHPLVEAESYSHYRTGLTDILNTLHSDFVLLEGVFSALDGSTRSLGGTKALVAQYLHQDIDIPRLLSIAEK